MARQHLTWGQPRQHGSDLILDEHRKVVGRFCWTDYVLLCGRPDDGEAVIPDLDHKGERPERVCRTCWRRFVSDMKRALDETEGPYEG